MSTDAIPVLAPPPELRGTTLDGFEAQLEPHLGSTADGIVLDLTSVRFINSAGLGCLVKTGMHLDRQGRRLAMACPQRSVEATLRLVGLDSKLPLFKSVPEALAFVRHHSSQGK